MNGRNGVRVCAACVVLLCLASAPPAAGRGDASKSAEDVMFPLPQPGRTVYEGFEISVPPPGWTAIVNNAKTWVQDDYAPYEGAFAASCFYDDAFSGPQDEWLYFDYVVESGDDCLCFYATGSTYWAVEPNQNYNFMVTIDDAVVWNYHDDNDGAVNWQWQAYCVDLTGHAPGETLSVCLGYRGYDGALASFDALSIGPCPPGPPPQCCPYETACRVMDFGAGGWGFTSEACGGRPGLWSWGTAEEAPSLACGGAAASNVLGVALGGPYPQGAGEAAILGPFAVTEDCSCLELCHFYETESGYDGGNVKVSDDGGVTWTLVRPDLGYDDVLDSAMSPPACLEGEEAFTGSSLGFVRDCFDVSAFAGSNVLVGLFFGSDDYDDGSRGWYVHEIRFGEQDTPVENASWGAIKAMYRR